MNSQMVSIMFSNEVSNVVRSFETQTLQHNGGSYYPNARITVDVPGSERAHAICTLFKLCNPSSKEYDFIASSKEGSRGNYSVILFTHSSKAGKLIDKQFMGALKNTINSFSTTLGSSWVPYTINKKHESFTFNNIEEETLMSKDSIDDSVLVSFTFNNMDKEETLMSKDSLDDSVLIYRYLSNQSGYEIKCDQIKGEVEGKYFDLIAGSKTDVEKCVDYFKQVGKSMQSEIK